MRNEEHNILILYSDDVAIMEIPENKLGSVKLGSFSAT